MHGVTRLVTFDARFQEPSVPNGALEAALIARTKITCGDFGMAGSTCAIADQIAAGELASIEIDLALVSYPHGSQKAIA
jgi:polyisoprenoid-binding protein YceI